MLGCGLSVGCDLQFHSALPLLPIIITTADGVQSTVSNANFVEGDAITFHLESPGDIPLFSLVQSVLSIIGYWRVRGDGEGHTGTATIRNLQIVGIQGVLW